MPSTRVPSLRFDQLGQFMNRGHQPHQTQWAAQLAVASERCRRGHQVALTLGNHPMVDLMVVSPKGKTFLVDVKGQYKKTFWPIKKRRISCDLFHVLAFVPPADQQNCFSVFTQNQIKDELERAQIFGDPASPKGPINPTRCQASHRYSRSKIKAAGRNCQDRQALRRKA